MRTLSEWLAFIERQHPKAIALGLDRVEEVRSRLGLLASCPVIIVGGTNGKGSTCAMLESILRCAGYRTGLYTSPHLLRYNIDITAVAAHLPKIRAASQLPIGVGFGIRDAASAKAIAAVADAVVIGSRIIEEIEAAGPELAVERVAELIRPIRAALDS